MRRASLIAGLLGFVGAVISGALNSQICIPCIALVLGAAAGYFACRAGRPADQNTATRLGATSGALAGVGTLLGSVVGGFLGAYLLGPAGAQSSLDSIARSLGVTVPSGPVSPVTYYGTALGVSACCGVGEVFIMAVLGALAALVWFRQTRGDVPALRAGQ
jgi:uncharacterized membrane protein YfcA